MTTADPATRTFFDRSATDRPLTGVAGGIGSALGVDSLFVRAGFALLSFAGGLGLLAYALGYVLSGEPVPGQPSRRITRRHTVGFLCVVTGAAWLARSVLEVVVPQVLIPLAFVMVGAAVVWSRADDVSIPRSPREPFVWLMSGRHAILRICAGIAIFAGGVALFLTQSDAFSSVRSAVVAMTATGVGLVFLLGPWLLRLYQALTNERRERIRSEERAEMSAHLHDSVLQTLALIQRSDASPDVVSLARRQERELRSWMLGHVRSESHLSGALDKLVEEVEGAYGVAVDVVIVGDVEVNEKIEALLAATREATVNAARHSGQRDVSVYVEVGRSLISAYVRDQGKGFDRADVADDRRGISESIEGRMRRAGGKATVRTEPAGGTEVELQLAMEVSS